MVSQKQWDRVQAYIRLGQEEGAHLLAGGEGRPQGLSRGWFVQPTIFSRVNNDMRIAREEIFGPVLSLIPYRDEDDAITIANDTDYGLQAQVFSSDITGHGVWHAASKPVGSYSMAPLMNRWHRLAASSNPVSDGSSASLALRPFLNPAQSLAEEETPGKGADCSDDRRLGHGLFLTVRSVSMS